MKQILKIIKISLIRVPKKILHFVEFENYHINITFEKNYSDAYSNQFLFKKL
jgi:hypothetical protein